MIVLQAEIVNARAFRGLGIKFQKLKKEALQDVAEFWHGRSFDEHFTPGNSARYSIKRRRELYLKKIKLAHGQGQGKWVDLLLRGQSQRWMRTFKTISGTGNQATIKLRPPGYFTNPFIGTFTNAKGVVKHVTQQPDKPAEVTQVNDADRRSMSWFLRKRLQERFAGVMFAGSGI